MNRALIRTYWRTLCLLAFVAMCHGAETTHHVLADEPQPSEYQVKAAYLFNFAKFVDWPASAFSDAQAPFVLGILGENPFGDAFDSVQGKSVRGRAFVVKKFNAVENIPVCHILFISASEKGRWQTIFKALQNRNVLLAGDVEGFVRAGGVVNFIIVNKNVGLEVNVDSAARNGLTFSSRILNMARIVRGAPMREGD
jgi:hypothetical protein